MMLSAGTAGIVLCLASGLALVSGSQPETALLDLNTATAEELVRLPGIGPTIAARIVAHRERNGAFRRVEELLIIRGISRKKFEKIRPLVTVGGEKTGPPR